MLFTVNAGARSNALQSSCSGESGCFGRTGKNVSRRLSVSKTTWRSTSTPSMSVLSLVSVSAVVVFSVIIYVFRLPSVSVVLGGVAGPSVCLGAPGVEGGATSFVNPSVIVINEKPYRHPLGLQVTAPRAATAA